MVRVQPALGWPLDLDDVRSAWPSVGVVITTRNRPFLVRRALTAVLAQDYRGPLRVVVVFDSCEPDWTLARSGDRPILVLENWRAGGRAGARNVGILATADCEWVAVCNDDDTWASDKLTRQVTALLDQPGSQFGTCSAEVEYDGRRTPRLLGPGPITMDGLGTGLAHTLAGSGFLIRHDVLSRAPERGGVGLFDENGPDGALEWDLLMRAARVAPIVHVDIPLVRVLWRQPPGDPRGRLRTLRWMHAQHPELRGRSRSAAHTLADLACWEAAAGHHAQAWSCVRLALRTRRLEPRTLLAVAAIIGLARGEWLRTRLARHNLHSISLP